MYNNIIGFIRDLYPEKETVSLHEPLFVGNEKKYLMNAVDSTFVSSVGQYVDAFEKAIADYVGAKYAVATVNGTAALHAALLVSGVGEGHEVITQPLTFVATCDAIKYCGATPTFVDIDSTTLGMSANALESYLQKSAIQKNGKCINKATGATIRACMPVHTFGHPVEIDRIQSICEEHNISLVEDAAESLGSYYKGQHTGTFGQMGVFSFNGNKIITSGGGGMIVTNDVNLAQRAKHLTTTAKKPHSWEYDHDEVGYNYRMPNINAALGLAQLEKIDSFLYCKRRLGSTYAEFFQGQDNLHFFQPSKHIKWNHWLNGVLFDKQKDAANFIGQCHQSNIYVRPVWKLMHKLKAFGGHHCLPVSEDLSARFVSLPSSVVEAQI